MEALYETSERVVEIPSPQKPVSNLSVTIGLLVFLLAFVGLFFGIGYVLGRSQASQTETTSNEKSTRKTEEGKTTFTDPKENYSIVFPEKWKLTEKVSMAPGVLLESEKNSVELWLRVDQPYSLSQEQKDSIAKTDKVKIKIGDRELEMTEHSYKTGGYFSVLVIPATTETPLATFWAKTLDKESYDEVVSIMKTFKFN